MSPRIRPSGWDRFRSFGHPSQFQRVSRLGSVTPTARQSSSERQPNFGALNRGRRATYVRQGDHRGGHWPTFLVLFSSPNLSGRRIDVYHTSTHDVVLRPSANLSWSEMCCTPPCATAGVDRQGQLLYMAYRMAPFQMTLKSIIYSKLCRVQFLIQFCIS